MFTPIAESLERYVLDIEKEMAAMQPRYNELREIAYKAVNDDVEAEAQVYQEIEEIESKLDDLDWKAWDARKIAQSFRSLADHNVTLEDPAVIVDTFLNVE